MWEDRKEFFRNDGLIDQAKAERAMRRCRADALRLGLQEVRRTVAPERRSGPRLFW